MQYAYMYFMYIIWIGLSSRGGCALSSKGWFHRFVWCFGYFELGLS